MRQDINHREVFAKPDTLGDDFAMIAEAFAAAFRGMASASRLESRWSKLRNCGDVRMNASPAEPRPTAVS